MKIKSIYVKNFRGIESAAIDLFPHTTILGRNGSGKSTLLKAIEYFYNTSAEASDLDYFGRDTDREIEIGITFTGLTSDEVERFQANIQDGDLRVVKIFNTNAPRGLYHSFGFQLPEFVAVRQIQGKQPRRDEYRRLQERYDLPNAQSADDVFVKLSEYEEAHPEDCELLPMHGQFMGTSNVGGGSLDNFTRFVFISASLGARDEFEGRGSGLHQLVDAVARSYKEKDEVKRIGKEYRDQIAEYFDNDNAEELQQITAGINQILEEYSEGSKVNFSWDQFSEPDLKLPSIVRSIAEDGIYTDVSRVGHGLQRTLVIALLQYLAVQDTDEAHQSKIILGIEEPEIFQHPSKAKFFSNLLRSLGVESEIQVILVTHSPYFVDPERFDSLVYSKRSASSIDGVRSTGFHSLNVEAALDLLATSMRVDRKNVSLESLKAFSQPVFTHHVREGFFARKVILVEGETEVGILEAIEGLLNLSWERKGVAIIPCDGKTKIDKPALIFSMLQIIPYLIFDWDKGSSGNGSDAQYNRGLQLLSGVAEEDLVEKISGPVTSNSRCLIFNDKIESYLRDIASDGFEEITARAAEETGNASLSSSDALKRSSVAKRFIEIAVRDYELRFEALEHFLREIDD